jgi:membrane protein DedA with SNARE-associated domain
MEAYLAKFGYIGIFIGTFLEGETTVLLGGILSRLGYMDFNKVLLWAFLGTFLGDCTFFSIGKCFGRNVAERYEFLRSRIPLANRIIEKYGSYIIFLIRFLVGIRAVILLLLGCTDIKVRKFLLYNAVNSVLWSLAVTLVGFLFANVVYVFVHDIRKYEHYLMPAILVLVFLCVVIYRHVMKEKEKAYGD